MSLKQPDVVTGARGPRDESHVQTLNPSEPTQVSGAIPDGEVWYQSRYARLRIQLTAPADERLPDGRIRREAPIVAQFAGAMIKLKKADKKDAKRIELLEEHPTKGTLFWNFADVLEKQAKTERDRAVQTLSNPLQRQLIIEALKAEGVDFALPKADKKVLA